MGALLLFASLAATAQDVTEFMVTQPGTLSELVPQEEYTTLSDMKITGTVDARDFFFIRDHDLDFFGIFLSIQARLTACISVNRSARFIRHANSRKKRLTIHIRHINCLQIKTGFFL